MYLQKLLEILKTMQPDEAKLTKMHQIHVLESRFCLATVYISWMEFFLAC